MSTYIEARKLGTNEFMSENRITSSLDSFRRRNNNLRIISDEFTLTPFELYNIPKYLPPPVREERIGDIQFSVYRVKNLYGADWNDLLLRRLVVEARRRYQEFYGKTLPLLDNYDLKSAIYLIHVSCKKNIDFDSPATIEEWFSLRFVPADKEPLGTEDLDFYIVRGNRDELPIIKAMQRNLMSLRGLDKKYLLGSIITISRFCSIKPYIIKNDKTLMAERIVNWRINFRKGMFASMSFSLMNIQFLEDSQRDGYNFKFATCQMHKIMSDEILTYPFNSGIKTLPFTTAYSVLGLQNNNSSVYIARNKPKVYTYSYPGYFLNLRSLLNALQALIKDGLLLKATIKKFLEPGITFEEVINNPRIYHFRNMGKLFTKNGKIPNETLTGEELRKYLDRNVEDGPILRIMDIKMWRDGVLDFIEYIKNKRNSINHLNLQ